MDNKTTPQPAPTPAAAPVAPPPPPAQNPPQATPPTPSKGIWHNKIIWIGGFLIFVILAIMIAFWFTSRQNSTDTSQQAKASTPPVVKSQQKDTFDTDLDSINIDETDSEFTALDKDLQGL